MDSSSTSEWGSARVIARRPPSMIPRLAIPQPSPSPPARADATPLYPASAPATHDVVLSPMTYARIATLTQRGGGLRSPSAAEEDTIRACRRSLRADPTLIEPYVVLARVLNRVGDHDAAIRVLEDGLARHPHESMLRHLLAIFERRRTGHGAATARSPYSDDSPAARQRRQRRAARGAESARSPNAFDEDEAKFSPPHAAGSFASAIPRAAISVPGVRTSLADIRRDAAALVQWEQFKQHSHEEPWQRQGHSYDDPSVSQLELDKERRMAARGRVSSGAFSPLSPRGYSQHHPTRPIGDPHSVRRNQPTAGMLSPISLSDPLSPRVGHASIAVPLRSARGRPLAPYPTDSRTSAADVPGSVSSGIPAPLYTDLHSPRLYMRDPALKSPVDRSPEATRSRLRQPRPPVYALGLVSAAAARVGIELSTPSWPLTAAAPAPCIVPSAPHDSVAAVASSRTRLLKNRLSQGQSFVTPAAVLEKSDGADSALRSPLISPRNAPLPVDGPSPRNAAARVFATSEEEKVSRRQSLKDSSARRLEAAARSLQAERDKLAQDAANARQAVEQARIASTTESAHVVRPQPPPAPAAAVSDAPAAEDEYADDFSVAAPPQLSPVLEAYPAPMLPSSEQHAAAIRIQSLARGRAARLRVRKMKVERVKEGRPSTPTTRQPTLQQQEAALRIQRVARGRAARLRVRKMRVERDDQRSRLNSAVPATVSEEDANAYADDFDAAPAAATSADGASDSAAAAAASSSDYQWTPEEIAAWHAEQAALAGSAEAPVYTNAEGQIWNAELQQWCDPPAAAPVEPQLSNDSLSRARAATRIQNVQRGRIARQHVKQLRASKREQQLQAERDGDVGRCASVPSSINDAHAGSVSDAAVSSTPSESSRPSSPLLSASLPPSIVSKLLLAERSYLASLEEQLRAAETPSERVCVSADVLATALHLVQLERALQDQEAEARQLDALQAELHATKASGESKQAVERLERELNVLQSKLQTSHSTRLSKADAPFLAPSVDALPHTSDSDRLSAAKEEMYALLRLQAYAAAAQEHSLSEDVVRCLHFSSAQAQQLAAVQVEVRLLQAAHDCNFLFTVPPSVRQEQLTAREARVAQITEKQAHNPHPSAAQQQRWKAELNRLDAEIAHLRKSVSAQVQAEDEFQATHAALIAARVALSAHLTSTGTSVSSGPVAAALDSAQRRHLAAIQHLQSARAQPPIAEEAWEDETTGVLDYSNLRTAKADLRTAREALRTEQLALARLEQQEAGSYARLTAAEVAAYASRRTLLQRVCSDAETLVERLQSTHDQEMARAAADAAESDHERSKSAADDQAAAALAAAQAAEAARMQDEFIAAERLRMEAEKVAAAQAEEAAAQRLADEAERARSEAAAKQAAEEEAAALQLEEETKARRLAAQSDSKLKRMTTLLAAASVASTDTVAASSSHIPPPPVLRPTAVRVVDETEWAAPETVSKAYAEAMETEPTIFEEYASFRVQVLSLDRVGKLGATRPYLVIQHQRGHIWEDVHKTETLLRETSSLNPCWEHIVLSLRSLNHTDRKRLNRFQIRHFDSHGQDITIGDVTLSFDDILAQAAEFQRAFPEQAAAGQAKINLLTRGEKNTSFSRASNDNAKKHPQYPELKSLPKTCCGVLLFHDISVRLKTTPGLLLSSTSRLFPAEDGPTQCSVRLNIHGTKLDKMDTLGKSDPFFQIWRLKPGGIIRPGLSPIHDDAGSMQDDLTQYDMVYQSDYIEHTLDPKFPTFVVPSLLLCECDYGTHLLLRMFDHDVGSSPDFIGSTHFTLREMMFALSEQNRDPLITNKRPLWNASKAAKDKKYANSGVLTFRGCDIFTRVEDVDAEADKSLARVRRSFEEKSIAVSKRQAYVVHLMHGQLLRKAEAALQHMKSKSDLGLGTSKRDVFHTFTGNAAPSSGGKSSRRGKSGNGKLSGAIVEEEDDEEDSEDNSATVSRTSSAGGEDGALERRRDRRKTRRQEQSPSSAALSIAAVREDDGEQDDSTMTSPRLPAASPSSSSSSSSAHLSLGGVVAMRSAASQFLASRSRDAVYAIVLHASALPKPAGSGFFSGSPEAVLELLADRKLRGQWETVFRSDAAQAASNAPTFPALMLKAKAFVASTSKESPGVHDVGSESALTCQVRVWHAPRGAEPVLLGQAVTSFLLLRTARTVLHLNDPTSGASAGDIITESAKAVNSALMDDARASKKEKKEKKDRKK